MSDQETLNRAYYDTLRTWCLNNLAAHAAEGEPIDKALINRAKDQYAVVHGDDAKLPLWLETLTP